MVLLATSIALFLGEPVLANEFYSVLGILANPIRANVLRCLESGPAGFTELLDYCSLDVLSQSGLLHHHVQRLMDLGFIERSGRTYQLTSHGDSAAGLLAKVAEAAERILGETRNGGKIVEEEDGIKVEKFQKNRLEAFVDFWLEEYQIDPSERDQIRDRFEEAISRRRSIYFLAWDSEQIVGYLAGRSLALRPLATRFAKLKTLGIVGHIDNIVIRAKHPTGARRIITALVDGYEKYFKSKPNCQGICADGVQPERMNMVFQVLQEKGFYVQNLSAVMRKDYRPDQRPGDRVPEELIRQST